MSKREKTSKLIIGNYSIIQLLNSIQNYWIQFKNIQLFNKFNYSLINQLFKYPLFKGIQMNENPGYNLKKKWLHFKNII